RLKRVDQACRFIQDGFSVRPPHLDDVEACPVIYRIGRALLDGFRGASHRLSRGCRGRPIGHDRDIHHIPGSIHPNIEFGREIGIAHGGRNRPAPGSLVADGRAFSGGDRPGGEKQNQRKPEPRHLTAFAMLEGSNSARRSWSRTPVSSPFSEMNRMPAASKAPTIFCAVPVLPPSAPSWDSSRLT